MYPEGERDVIDLGERNFLRPIHELVRRSEPIGTPVLARPDSPVIGFTWWHDCPGQPEGSWLEVWPGSELVRCEICGAAGRVIGDRWVKEEV